ncbi:MAG: energy transducer TonB [Gemmatimonadaceae bacterium]
MPTTVFTPTATLWRSSSALAVAFAAACITSTTQYYVPNTAMPRLTTNQMRDQADAMLRVECPRLLGDRQSAFAVAELVVDLEASGEVIRARVDRSSGDRRMDEIFGALAAQLKLDPPSPPAGNDVGPLQGDLSVGYSCSPTAAVTSVELGKSR